MALPGPGVYRVEARVPGWPVPWVITNPVYVHDASRERGRVPAPAAWPGPPPAPREVRPLASLEGSPAFDPEFDPSSWMDGAVHAPGEGPDGGEASKLAFRLGAPTASQPFTWCALVNRQARDLSAYAGLRFRVRADGEYRLWVQVRDVNPASADEGLEWWLASARTSGEWREVQLPFSRFRTINREDRRPARPRRDARPRLRAGRGLGEGRHAGHDLDQRRGRVDCAAAPEPCSSSDRGSG